MSILPVTPMYFNYWVNSIKFGASAYYLVELDYKLNVERRVFQ